MMELSGTELQQNHTWLLIGAIFFAMRSCEYIRTPGKEETKRTKMLRLRNMKFKKNGVVLSHDSRQLKCADIVIITFEFQKNKMRNRTVHMFSTGDNLLCPVVAWATTVQRILNTIPNATGDTKMCSYIAGGIVREVESAIIRGRLRAIVEVIGEKILGFTKDDVGLHSIRSGGAMAMFLAGVSEIIIQRIGRWKSDAFLEYIREQVENFTFGVSKKMLQHEKMFHIEGYEENNIIDTGGIEKNENTTYKMNGNTLCGPYPIDYNDQL